MSENAGSNTAASGGNSFSIARVLILLLVAVAVTGGAYLAFFMERGPKPLYPFSGQVLLNGIRSGHRRTGQGRTLYAQVK